MGFLDQTEKTEKPKKKRKRRKKSTGKALSPARSFKLMIPIKEKLPPDTNEQVITYGEVFGFDVRLSFGVLQHMYHDIKTLGYSRVTHWYPTKEM